MRTTKCAITTRRGLIITDAVIGLSILAMLLAITAITVGHDKRASRAAEAHRQLTFEAESALLALQAGAPPSAPDDLKIALTFQENQGQAPAGLKWITVVAMKEGQSVELSGLVPEGTIKPHALPAFPDETGAQP